MALSTYSAPVYGGSTLKIELPNEMLIGQRHNYFLIYEGTDQRHVTTARLESPKRLCSTIPGHNIAETVQLSVTSFLCAEETAITSCSCTEQTVVTSCSFSYCYDGVHHLANFLVNSVHYQHALDDLELIRSDDFDLSEEELSTLDWRLSRALSNLILPETWSLLGAESQSEHLEPRETLLHFAARLGLIHVILFFLGKPGSEQALKLSNRNGNRPIDVAIASGFSDLVEHFSDYNVYRPMMVNCWWETNNGIVLTPETGDVTLTLKLHTHHTTVVEDIIVLNGLKRQLQAKGGNTLQHWQTDWPVDRPTYTDRSHNVENNANTHFQAICEKVHNLPKLVSLETVEHDCNNKFVGLYDNTTHVQCDVGLSEDCDVTVNPLSRWHDSADDISGIMNGSLNSLRNYNNKLLKIREKSTLFRNVLEQDLRKFNLARFSTSCPSFDVGKLPLTSMKDAVLCKSMLDLAPDSTASPASHFSGDFYSSGPYQEDSTDYIQAIIDSASTDSFWRFELQTQEYEQFLNGYYGSGGDTSQVHRCSLSPLTMNNHVDDGQLRAPMTFTHISKSSSGMPTENEGVNYNLFYSHNDVECNSHVKMNHSASDSKDGDGHRQKICSSGDIEYDLKDYKDSNHPANFTKDSSHMLTAKQNDKDGKKHKINVFSRLYNNNYRKTKDKDEKIKASSTHRFVSVSCGKATTCDLCYRSLTNKPALHCQICQMNIHEALCKEQVTLCEKSKSKGQFPSQSASENEIGSSNQERNKVQMALSNMRFDYSIKENGSPRPQTAYGGSTTQPVPVQIITEEQKLPASSQVQRKSLPTSSCAMVEEVAANHVSRLDLVHSNIAESIFYSVESPDEVDGPTELISGPNELYFDDVELGSLVIEEPETWSETVDKKVLKKFFNSKDIKRQDTIWELIQTERHYCKRLKTLQKVFRDGMQEVLSMTNEFLERMFPHLNDLISVHMGFLRQLQNLQNKTPDKSIKEIGPTLHYHFSGDSANTMKKSYGTFCSRHLESLQCYKDMLARDKHFQEFIKKRTSLPLCKKLEIPGFILLITQRPTKYPTLIEAVIKTTTDEKDRQSLLIALDKSKEVLQSINEQVAASERAARLKEIISKLDSRTYAIYRGKKFRKSDVVSKKRFLLHDGVINLRNARCKSVEVLVVVLTDVLLFLQENNQKYSFFSLDSKACVVSLFNLLVREKGDTKDTKGLYIINQDRKNPEMYEVAFNTASDAQKWAAILRSAVDHCPPEDEEEMQKEAEAEHRQLEEKEAQVRLITEKLNQKDQQIEQLCDEKKQLLVELLMMYNDANDQQSSPLSSRDIDETVGGSEHAHMLTEVSKAATHLTMMLQQEAGSNLGRSGSSAGEHLSRNFSVVPLPKRAETFAGFDNDSTTLVRLQGIDTTDIATDMSHDTLYNKPDTSDPDVGLKVCDSESAIGEGSSVNQSASSIPSLSAAIIHGFSQDQINVGSLAQTLNDIVHVLATQSTTVEKLKAQLAVANEKINKLSTEVQDKKIGNKHVQLEELRNLQGVLQKEKDEWELKKAREKSNLEQEYQHLEESKRLLDKQENDLKQQKEELNKKREVLQRQMELLRQSGQLPKDTPLSDQEITLAGADRANVQSSVDFMPGHRRSASADFLNSSKGDNKSNKGDNKSNKGDDKTASAAPKENNFRMEQKSVTKLQSFSCANTKQPLPVHLLSATNEQKVGSKSIQKIPSKLLMGVSISTSQQTTQLLGFVGQSQSNAGLDMHTSQPAMVSVDVLSERDRGQLGLSSSAINMKNSQNPLGSSSSVPKGSWVSNRPKPPVAGIGGVLKLAEKGEKKSVKSLGSSQADKGVPVMYGDSVQSSQQPKSGTPPNKKLEIIHKSQKSDSDVIYC